MKYKGPVKSLIKGVPGDNRSPALMAEARRMLGLIESTLIGSPSTSVARYKTTQDGSVVRVVWTPLVKSVYIELSYGYSHKKTKEQLERDEDEVLLKNIYVPPTGLAVQATPVGTAWESGDHNYVLRFDGREVTWVDLQTIRDMVPVKASKMYFARVAAHAMYAKAPMLDDQSEVHPSDLRPYQGHLSVRLATNLTHVLLHPESQSVVAVNGGMQVSASPVERSDVPVDANSDTEIKDALWACFSSGTNQIVYIHTNIREGMPEVANWANTTGLKFWVSRSRNYEESKATGHEIYVPLSSLRSSGGTGSAFIADISSDGRRILVGTQLTETQESVGYLPQDHTFPPHPDVAIAEISFEVIVNSEGEISGVSNTTNVVAESEVIENEVLVNNNASWKTTVYYKRWIEKDNGDDYLATYEWGIIDIPNDPYAGTNDIDSALRAELEAIKDSEFEEGESPDYIMAYMQSEGGQVLTANHKARYVVTAMYDFTPEGETVKVYRAETSQSTTFQRDSTPGIEGTIVEGDGNEDIIEWDGSLSGSTYSYSSGSRKLLLDNEVLYNEVLDSLGEGSGTIFPPSVGYGSYTENTSQFHNVTITGDGYEDSNLPDYLRMMDRQQNATNTVAMYSGPYTEAYQGEGRQDRVEPESTGGYAGRLYLGPVYNPFATISNTAFFEGSFYFVRATENAGRFYTLRRFSLPCNKCVQNVIHVGFKVGAVEDSREDQEWIKRGSFFAAGNKVDLQGKSELAKKPSGTIKTYEDMDFVEQRECSAYNPISKVLVMNRALPCSWTGATKTKDEGGVVPIDKQFTERESVVKDAEIYVGESLWGQSK